MKTLIEVQIADGKAKPKVVRSGGGWSVVAEVEQHVANGRAVWIRTWNPCELSEPKDGKGFLVGLGRKLRVG